ncbi:MAG TPA: HAMP domain-containing sensor histidine kinase, partial [Rhodothermales bacterium]|nr:HAMP domain-containing sensor histidine kinase [Rhodothermales bacterium]
AIPEGTRAIQVDRVYDPALDTTPVMAVPSALGRLFLNLIENAAQAVRQRAGGESEGYVPTIEIETKLGEDRMGRAAATIIVSDNGPGIPDAVLPRVFEPFYTTKGPGQGTGLGLSLAYDIALGHGGSLVADHTDADEAGAVFIVTLPLRPAEEPEAAESVEE